MITVKFITIGELKERYLTEACAEYKKRLGAWCRVEEHQLKEERLCDSPSPKEIKSALLAEEGRIFEKISPKTYLIALCIEGKQLSSEELGEKISQIALSGYSEIAFVIGSSFGLSDGVKERASMRLSFSRLTFPHQLMRVILYEATYRAFSIINNTKYHK